MDISIKSTLNKSVNSIIQNVTQTLLHHIVDHLAIIGIRISNPSNNSRQNITIRWRPEGKKKTHHLLWRCISRSLSNCSKTIEISQNCNQITGKDLSWGYNCSHLLIRSLKFPKKMQTNLLQIMTIKNLIIKNYHMRIIL